MNNRQATISNYAARVIEDMDFKTLLAFATETIIENLDDFTDEQIIELVHEYDEDNVLGIIE